MGACDKAILNHTKMKPHLASESGFLKIAWNLKVDLNIFRAAHLFLQIHLYRNSQFPCIISYQVSLMEKEVQFMQAF